MQFDQATATMIPRSLGALEKMFWLADQNRPMHFTIAAEVGGATTVEEWQSALDHVCRQSALIWSRIILDQDGAAIFSPVRRGSIPLRVVENTVSGWTDYVASELAKPFDASIAPLLRATLLHSPDRAVIILCVHHSIADGLALSFLMRDVLRAYADEPVQLSAETASLEDLVASRRKLMTMPQEQATRPVRPTIPYRALGGSPRVEAMRLTGDMTRSLRERARVERSTLHGALCAAVTAVAARLVPAWSDVPLRVLSPIDVRGRLLNSSEHFGLCVTGLVLEDEGGTNDFWTKARFFSDGLKPMKSVEGVATRIQMLNRAVSPISTVQQAQEFLAQRFSAEILLTNLGAPEVKGRYGPLTLHALWGPAVLSAFANAQTVGAVTIGNQLHLLHTSCGAINGLLAEVSSLLNAALEEAPGRAPQKDARKTSFFFPDTVS